MKSFSPPQWTIGVLKRFRSQTGPIENTRPVFAGILWVLFMGLASFLLTESHGQGPEPPSQGGPAQPPTLVKVVKITEKDVNPPEEFVGRIEAIQTVDLRAQVSGYLQEVVFKEGELVKAGEVLYQIEKAPYVARVNANKGRVEKARATFTLTQQYLKRLQSADSGAVSATDIETAESEMAQAKASLEEAKATLEQSRINLGYTTIKAPITGRIGKNNFTRGNLVGPDSGTLARIVQIDPIRVVFSISENELSRIQKTGLKSIIERLKSQHRIQLQFPNGEIYEALGWPDFLANEVDPNTGTIAFRARFDNPTGLLVPGQYVTVLISRSEARKKPVVPQAAVLEDREGRYVFVVDREDQVEQRRIETAEMLETVWAVKSGLDPGEIVVVQGLQKVQPGQKVKAAPLGQEREGAQR
ncbi:MAG: efflux RND transporter periplasmic adaptor subunit [Desulfatiglandaceae bacterium]